MLVLIADPAGGKASLSGHLHFEANYVSKKKKKT